MIDVNKKDYENRSKSPKIAQNRSKMTSAFYENIYLRKMIEVDKQGLKETAKDAKTGKNRQKQAKMIRAHFA